MIKIPFLPNTNTSTATRNHFSWYHAAASKTTFWTASTAAMSSSNVVEHPSGCNNEPKTSPQTNSFAIIASVEICILMQSIASLFATKTMTCTCNLYSAYVSLVSAGLQVPLIVLPPFGKYILKMWVLDARFSGRLKQSSSFALHTVYCFITNLTSPPTWIQDPFVFFHLTTSG